MPPSSAQMLISAAAAIIAAVAALISMRNVHREQLNQKMVAAKWKQEYFSNLLKWTDEAMLQLSEAIHLCELNPNNMADREFEKLCHSLRIRLSAQIDRGRMFFPNHVVDYGLQKLEGFRGFRHEVLDGLVSAYQGLSAIDCSNASNNRETRQKIEHAKRLFVSEIQKVLDPRSRDKEFRKLTEIVAKN